MVRMLHTMRNCTNTFLIRSATQVGNFQLHNIPSSVAAIREIPHLSSAPYKEVSFPDPHVLPHEKRTSGLLVVLSQHAYGNFVM